MNTVTINRYFAAEKSWTPPADSGVKVIARLRNKAPLAVERKLGEGRVVAMLTKASPVVTSLGSWNNWGRDNPSYVVALLEMQSYLSGSRHPDTSRLVGTPLAVPVDVARYMPQVKFAMPREAGGAIDRPSTPCRRRRAIDAVLAETDASGIYQAQLTGTDGSQHVEHFAFNVTPEEGDLHKLDGEQLAAVLDGVALRFHQARATSTTTRSNWPASISARACCTCCWSCCSASNFWPTCAVTIPPAKEGAMPR